MPGRNTPAADGQVRRMELVRSNPPRAIPSDSLHRRCYRRRYNRRQAPFGGWSGRLQLKVGPGVRCELASQSSDIIGSLVSFTTQLPGNLAGPMGGRHVSAFVSPSASARILSVDRLAYQMSATGVSRQVAQRTELSCHGSPSRLGLLQALPASGKSRNRTYRLARVYRT